MKLKNLFEFEEKEFKLPEGKIDLENVVSGSGYIDFESLSDSDQFYLDELYITPVVEYAQQNCSKAINEFIRSGNFVYRGLDGFQSEPYNTFVIPSIEERTLSFGTVFSNKKVLKDFSEYIEEQDGARRDSNVVITTTTQPENFKGINVSNWFYMLPIGDYRYSYFKEGGPDVNIDFTSSVTITTLEYLSNIITNIRAILYNNLDMAIDNFIGNMEDHLEENENPFIKKEDFFSIKDDIERFKHYMVYFLDHQPLFSEKTLQSINKKLKTHEPTISEVIEINQNKVIPEELYIPLTSLEESLSDIYRLMQKVVPSVEKILEDDGGIVSNEITESFKNKEVWFNTKKYLAIPYGQGIGEEIIKRLK